MIDFAAEFIKELMKDITSELKNKNYDADSMGCIEATGWESNGSPLFVYVENIKVCTISFCDGTGTGPESPKEGLYLSGGDLEHDHNYSPIYIDLNNKDYINQIISLVESKRKYLALERNNYVTDGESIRCPHCGRYPEWSRSLDQNDNQISYECDCKSENRQCSE